jgi:hypothetical protein
MKRFFSGTATDAKNQTLEGAIVSMTHAEILVQCPLPRNSRRIPVVFLGAFAPDEEQPVRVRFAPIEFPRKPVSKKGLLPRGLSLVGCP